MAKYCYRHRVIMFAVFYIPRGYGMLAQYPDTNLCFCSIVPCQWFWNPFHQESLQVVVSRLISQNFDSRNFDLDAYVF